jgi:hypothetical protein
MKNVLFRSQGVLFCLIATLFASNSHADTWCTLSNFVVDAYDHGGVYAHGTLTGGTYAAFIDLCGTTNGTEDCYGSSGTSRREAVALAAQAGGHNLNLYFIGITSCSQYQMYMRPASVQMLN